MSIAKNFSFISKVVNSRNVLQYSPLQCAVGYQIHIIHLFNGIFYNVVVVCRINLPNLMS